MRINTSMFRAVVFLMLSTGLLACQAVVPEPDPVAVVSSATPYPTSVPYTDTPVPTPTATLRPSSTPLPTLTLAPSLTPIPTSTPTPAIFGLGFTTGPFRDDFSDPGSGWVNDSGTNWSIGYYEGGYRIVNEVYKVEITASRSRVHTDFIIEADVHKLSGADSAYFGVTCRKVGETYFTMGITGAGEYMIVKTTNDVPAIMVEGTHPAIKKGDVVNHLKGSCIGKQISLAVNGVDVASIFNEGPLFGNFVGIIAGTLGEPGIEVKFDNFNSYPTGNAPAYPSSTPAVTATRTPTATP